MLSTLACHPRFAYGESAAIAAAVDEHGFAVVDGVLDDDLVASLRDDVCRAVDASTIPEGEARYCMDLVERSPGMWRLLGDERYLDLNRALCRCDALTIHRSAAVVRMPGAPGQAWHTDNPPWPGEPDCANAVLNRWDEFPAGMMFYLGGCAPERGGLAVIAGSHRPGWRWPQARAAEDPRWAGVETLPVRCDLPGMVPIVCGPRDLVIFAARTWHAALPYAGPGPRLMCGVLLRPRRIRVAAPWPLPEHARRFVATAPEPVRRLCDGYVGIDAGWGPGRAS
jgi:hypothetical protein